MIHKEGRLRESAREVPRPRRARGSLLALLGVMLLIVPAGAQPAGPPGKESPYEEVLVQLLASLEQMTKALAPVKDLASIEAARPGLKQAKDQFLAVRKKTEQLKQPDLKDREALAEKYQKKLADAVQHLRAEIRRVQDLPGGLALLKEWDEVFKPAKKK